MTLRRQPSAPPGASSASVLDPDLMLVLIDAFDGDQAQSRAPWKVENWPASPTHQPAAGDRCLVQRDQTGRVWVIVGDWTDPIPTPDPWVPDWQPLPLAAGWAEFDATLYPVGYGISPFRELRLRGLVRKTTGDIVSGDTVATLPLAPATDKRRVSSLNSSTLVEITVTRRGAVIVQSGLSLAGSRASYVSLDDVTFWLEND